LKCDTSFLTESVLGSVHQTNDIRLMTPDSQCGNQ